MNKEAKAEYKPLPPLQDSQEFAFDLSKFLNYRIEGKTLLLEVPVKCGPIFREDFMAGMRTELGAEEADMLMEATHHRLMKRLVAAMLTKE